MPYDSTASLPSHIKSLPPTKQRQWMHVFNSALERCQNGGTQDRDDCESRAFAQANGVINGKATHSMEAQFKELTAATRKRIPKGQFLFVDADGKGHLPVHDEAHIRNAISRLGNTKTGRKWGLTPEKRKELQRRAQNMLARHGSASHSAATPYRDRLSPYRDVALDVATFTIDSKPEREGANVVYRPATIFKAGDYPDKEFSLSPTELLKAASDFSQPVPIDLEHRTTPLDGHLGELVAVEPESDGSALHGIVKYPKWLNSILPNPKLSATWDRASKTLVGLALVNQPRIPEAALFAAFSADQVVRGKSSLDDLAQMMTVRFDDDGDDSEPDDDDDDKKVPPFLKGKTGKKKAKGAAKAKKKGAAFAGEDRDGMAALGGERSQRSNDGPARFARRAQFAQVVHDATVSRGAVCRVEPQQALSRGPYGIVRFGAGKATFQMIHDTSLQMGAACSPGSGKRDLPGRYTWEWPGITNEGRSPMPGQTKAPHFSSTRGGDKMGKGLGRRLAAFLAELEADEDVMIPGAAEYSGRDHESGYATQDEATRALREQVAQLTEDNRKMRQQGIYDKAVTFADKLIADGRAVPVERENIIKLHIQAGNDDTFVGTASFSDGQSRVSQLEAAYMARPKHLMDVETAGEAMQTAVAMFNKMRTSATPTAEGGTMSPERRAQLLSLDSVGRKVLSDERSRAS